MDREYKYAKKLAENIWAKFYKEDAPGWEPLPDLLGVLTQIDNMVSDLEPPKESLQIRKQKEFVDSPLLPFNCRDKKILRQAGVKFGEPLPDDPIFCIAVLPEGWSKNPTYASLWTELLDSSGNIRANIYYNAAVSDRSAFMEPEVCSCMDNGTGK